jgi:hypothetical protein
MANGAMKGSIVAMLKIWKSLIPCTWMLGVVYFLDMHNHHVEYLYLSISFGVEGSGFG